MAASVLVPFLTVYVAHGLLTNDLRNFVNSAVADEFNSIDLSGREATDFGSRAGLYPLTTVLIIVLVAVVLRYLLARTERLARFTALALLGALVEVYYTTQVGGSSMPRRPTRAHVGGGPPLRVVGADVVRRRDRRLGWLAHPVDTVTAWVFRVLGSFDALVVVPLAWLTVAAVVLGLVAPPAPVAHPILDRLAVVPAPVRKGLGNLTTGVRSRFTGLFHGLRLLARARTRCRCCCSPGLPCAARPAAVRVAGARRRRPGRRPGLAGLRADRVQDRHRPVDGHHQPCCWRRRPAGCCSPAPRPLQSRWSGVSPTATRADPDTLRHDHDRPGRPRLRPLLALGDRPGVALEQRRPRPGLLEQQAGEGITAHPGHAVVERRNGCRRCLPAPGCSRRATGPCRPPAGGGSAARLPARPPVRLRASRWSTGWGELADAHPEARDVVPSASSTLRCRGDLAGLAARGGAQVAVPPVVTDPVGVGADGEHRHHRQGHQAPAVAAQPRRSLCGHGFSCPLGSVSRRVGPASKRPMMSWAAAKRRTSERAMPRSTWASSSRRLSHHGSSPCATSRSRPSQRVARHLERDGDEPVDPGRGPRCR